MGSVADPFIDFICLNFFVVVLILSFDLVWINCKFLSHHIFTSLFFPSCISFVSLLSSVLRIK